MMFLLLLNFPGLIRWNFIYFCQKHFWDLTIDLILNLSGKYVDHKTEESIARVQIKNLIWTSFECQGEMVQGNASFITCITVWFHIAFKISDFPVLLHFNLNHEGWIIFFTSSLKCHEHSQGFKFFLRMRASISSRFLSLNLNEIANTSQANPLVTLDKIGNVESAGAGWRLDGLGGHLFALQFVNGQR